MEASPAYRLSSRTTRMVTEKPYLATSTAKPKDNKNNVFMPTDWTVDSLTM